MKTVCVTTVFNGDINVSMAIVQEGDSRVNYKTKYDKKMFTCSKYGLTIQQNQNDEKIYKCFFYYFQ